MSLTSDLSLTELWGKFNTISGKNRKSLCNSDFILNSNEKSLEYLKLIYKEDDSDQIIAPNLPNTTYQAELDIFTKKFYEQELQDVIKKAKNSAPGKDNIRYKWLKQLNNEGFTFILDQLNKIWENLNIPPNWKEIKVIPILKPKKDPENIMNYRPICLFVVFEKLLSKMILNRLDCIIAMILPETTYGFRKNFSATMCVNRIIYEIKAARAKRKKAVIIFMDLEKAYDGVDPKILKQKLNDYHFSNKIVDYFINIISKRTMIINNSCIQTSQGLPQGWGPSPILFNLYTLELHWHNSEKSKVIQFADDVAVMGFGKVLKEAEENAQTLVNKIYNELQNMKLKVNYRKSKVMKFGDKSREHPTIKIDNKLIEYTNSHKYLGIVIDQKLTFKTRH